MILIDFVALIILLILGSYFVLTIRNIFKATSDPKNSSKSDDDLISYSDIDRKLSELRRKRAELTSAIGTKEEMIQLQEEINVLEQSVEGLNSEYDKVYINRTGPRTRTWSKNTKGGTYKDYIRGK